MIKQLNAKKVFEAIAKNFELDINGPEFTRQEKPVRYTYKVIKNAKLWNLCVTTKGMFFQYGDYDMKKKRFLEMETYFHPMAVSYDSTEAFIDDIIKRMTPCMDMFKAEQRDIKIDSIFSDGEVKPLDYTVVVPKKQKITPLINFAVGDICSRPYKGYPIEHEVIAVTDNQIVIRPLEAQAFLPKKSKVNLNENGTYIDRYGSVTKS